jgi:hypothetical protein
MTICKHVNDNGDRCKKCATYNLEGEKKRLYCGIHKKEDMIYIVSKRCMEEGCKTLPSYNLEGEKKRLYCGIHKKEGMIDIRSKTCMEEGCKKQPSYNLEGEKERLYCATHKKDNMIDVKHKTCIEEGCKTLPSYNLEGEKERLYCATHKKDNMIDVKHKTCIEEGCKTIPTFNIEGKKALYCNEHKKYGMEAVSHKTCLTPLCDTRPSKDGYCSRCFYYTFPDKHQSRNYKSKEIEVTNFIKDNFKDYKVTFDQIISQGCSKRRPDIFIELYTHCIIIEVDEDQHLGYDSTCENKRIVELYQDLGYRNLVYIRFNPDKYKIKDENDKIKTIRSCFSKDKDGKIKIGSSKDWNHRLQKLNECITKNIENIPFKSISYEYLFYDETD